MSPKKTPEKEKEKGKGKGKKKKKSAGKEKVKVLSFGKRESFSSKMSARIISNKQILGNDRAVSVHGGRSNTVAMMDRSEVLGLVSPKKGSNEPLHAYSRRKMVIAYSHFN